MAADLHHIRPGRYDELRSEFEWDVPDTHNMAVDICDRWADERHKIALYWEDSDGVAESYTFTEMTQWSNRFPNALVDRGVGRGDTVAIYLPTLPESFVTTLGTHKIGAVSMPLYHLFGPDGVSQRTGSAEPDVIVTDDEGLDTLERASAVPEDVLLVRGEAGTESPLGPARFEDVLAGQSRDFDPVETDPEEPAMLFYTSGTTGDPKGVLHGHRYSIAHREIGKYMRDFTPEDRLWHNGDLAWAGGFSNLVEAWSQAIPLLKYHGRFDPRRGLELLQDYDVTLFSTAPTALRQFMKVPEDELADYDVADLRLVVTGGERVTPDLLEWTGEVFDAFSTTGWGQTETYGVGWPSLGEKRDEKLSTMDKPLPGFEAAIIDEDGTELPAGEVGELAIAREDNLSMFLKYFQNPEATAAVTEGRWHRTGDAVYTDEDGFLLFQGRQDDVIISSGYRLSPAEIEGSLSAHDAVQEVAVVGIPDEERTNIPKAFVQLRAGYEPSDNLASELQEHVKSELAKFQYPREVEFVEELPKTITGKIKRRQLRARESVD